MTISHGACAAIDNLFERTLRDISVVDADDSCSVMPCDPPVGGFTEAVPRRLATCNISAFGFRIVIFYEFAVDAATTGFLRRKFRLAESDGDDGFPADACMEFINMATGAAKGMLGAAVPHNGMSTPALLEDGCRMHVAVLKPAHVRSLEILTSCGCRFHVSYCICVGNKSKVDFSIDMRAPEPEPVGELEMF